MADITRYLNLITSEHSSRPNFRSLVTAMLEKIDITLDVDNLLDIDNAVGNQLDIIGQSIGVSRNLTFQPSDGSSPVLTDDQYRRLLKARIILNPWNGSMGELNTLLGRLETNADYTIRDNQDMTVSITVRGASVLLQEMIQNGYIAPKTAGVRFNFTMSNDVLFAYDSNTTTLAGYGTGIWL